MKIQENLGIFHFWISAFGFSKLFWGFAIETSKNYGNKSSFKIDN